jgi:heme-degrading monooxygenase HmoA
MARRTSARLEEAVDDAVPVGPLPTIAASYSSTVTLRRGGRGLESASARGPCDKPLIGTYPETKRYPIDDERGVPRAVAATQQQRKETTMTTLVLMRARFEGDADELARRYTSDADLLEARDRAGQPQGVQRHRVFAVDGELIVVDEWDSPEQFRAWIGSSEVQKIFGGLGIAEPDVTFADQLTLGDEIG